MKIRGNGFSGNSKSGKKSKSREKPGCAPDGQEKALRWGKEPSEPKLGHGNGQGTEISNTFPSFQQHPQAGGESRQEQGPCGSRQLQE